MYSRIQSLRRYLGSLPEKPESLSFPLREEELETFFFRLTKKYSGCFLLESHPEYSNNSRYTILGFEPPFRFRGGKNTFQINGRVFSSEHPYQTLRSLFPSAKRSKRYNGGLVGYLSYDSVFFFEPVTALAGRNGFPFFSFGLYLDGIVLDRLKGEAEYFFYRKNRIESLLSILGEEDSESGNVSVTVSGYSKTKEEYFRMFSETKEEIAAGNTFQCQIGFEERFKIEGNIFPIYRSLKKKNPSPYLFYYKDEELEMAGSSPELLFSHHDRIVETYPLAGTYPRGKTPEEDRTFTGKLLSDEKELAEHSMLIDLHRNDLSRICETGTVRLRKEFEILKFAHVQHISSEVTGILKRDEDCFGGLASVFPAGTLSGAPKVESIKIIRRIESEERGPYGGVLGYLSLDGSAQFCILIRSLFKSGNFAYSRAASGIVFDSEKELEYNEILNKLKAIKSAVEEYLS
ncbi:anthranilate synthase component I family protein [Leptospira gomenensis]|uniref:Anthranilate synthase component I family protein n=1 Tax=Leptospira gomenensis TaxID=2484974 RepID=A0A5F1YIG7_9LEPT|nr:anthranilate synthase component I family protein [Leptospira gomenensis]TGK34520.1 anthranilate synthase component I family protein [Leptospira gomenensis]TGK40170.1 anthranilate synthase component I family protein [Leptospira gomenensis]TGK41905.1 anthranilate synthase component I family protein [Leptospira gomenensis]TGK55679.1 anthranilate synthase component I family protein [Leptospira gomenensis]